MSQIGNSAYGSIKLQDTENLRNIKTYEYELEKQRKEELGSTLKSVTEVKSELESLKTDVLKNCVNEQESLELLKKKMLCIEQKISWVKEIIKEELIELIKDETVLLKDIRFLEKRIDDWSKPISTKIFKPLQEIKSRIRSGSGNNPTEEFRKFLSASGGHSGGWEEQDHILFLRERNKYKGKQKFITAVQTLLPDFSYEEILEHENWYTKYESLKNSQKEAIQKWKAEKLINLNQPKEVKVDNKEETSTKKTIHHKNIVERIKKWKEQQLVKKLEEEKRQKEEKQKLQEEERKKKALQEAKKIMVNQYKAEKIQKIQDEIFKQSEEKFKIPQSKSKNKILLKTFRLQDVKFIEKKKIMRLQLESKNSEKFERLKLGKPAIEILLKRNPQRIFQPTIIWNQHCQRSERREKTTPVFNLNSIPRLAIPEWRKELK